MSVDLWKCLANFIDKVVIINIHIIEGINPRPGDGLSHLRHGVSGVDKMTPISALFSNYWRKKNRHRPKTMLGPNCVRYSHCLPAANQFNMASHGVERTWRMSVEVHTEKCTERPDSILDLE